MAPEQWKGQPADARADIYSFGLVLYEMLSGTRVVSQRPRVASRKLAKIVGRCLEEDPGRRWQSIAELEQELSALTAATRRGKRSTAALVPLPAGKSTILLAEFSNATGDPAFDGALRQIVAVQLENAPRLCLLSDARVSQTLRLMGRPANVKLTQDVAAEICERTASAAVVEGSITSLGSEYALSVHARNCQTGEILYQEQARAAEKEEVFKALAQLAKRFGSRAGASLPHVEPEPDLSTKNATPRTPPSNSVTCLPCGGSTRSMRVTRRKRSK
jgi:hypothetical protein